MTLLLAQSLTRVNDNFVNANSSIDFSPVIEDFNDPLVLGLPQYEFRFQADFYKTVGVDIVAETVFEYPYPFITEKTYRSMASLRPFIIVGPYQMLEFLKSVGFQTFSAIINESYDNIQDPELRFHAVCDCIKEFVMRPLEDIKTDLQKIESALIHNQQHLSNLTNLELEKFKAQIYV